MHAWRSQWYHCDQECEDNTQVCWLLCGATFGDRSFFPPRTLAIANTSHVSGGWAKPAQVLWLERHLHVAPDHCRRDATGAPWGGPAHLDNLAVVFWPAHKPLDLHLVANVKLARRAAGLLVPSFPCLLGTLWRAVVGELTA